MRTRPAIADAARADADAQNTTACTRAFALSSPEKPVATCGNEWWTTPYAHYSGNFYWARCEYVSRLQPPCVNRTDYLCPELWILGSVDQAASNPARTQESSEARALRRSFVYAVAAQTRADPPDAGWRRRLPFPSLANETLTAYYPPLDWRQNITVPPKDPVLQFREWDARQKRWGVASRGLRLSRRHSALGVGVGT